MFVGEVGKLFNSIKVKSKDIYNNSLKAWKNKEIIENNNFLLKKKFLLQINAKSIDKSVIEIEQSKAMSLLNCRMVRCWIMGHDLRVRKFQNFHSHKTIEINPKITFSFAERKNVIFFGVKNLILVNHKDTILVLKKGNSEKIKKVIDFLKNN